MDPLNALSCAGTIVQFVDFSTRILSRTYELYKSPNSIITVNQELDLVATDLFQLSQKLRVSVRDVTAPDTEDERMLENLCLASSEIATELTTRLNDLRVQGKHRKWKSFQQAIKSVWSERDIMELTQRLSTLRDSVQIHVVVGLRDRMDGIVLSQSENFRSLDEKTQHIVTALLSQKDIVEDQAVAITRLLGKVELIAEDQRLTARALEEIGYAKEGREASRAQNETSSPNEAVASLQALRHEFQLSEKQIRSQVSNMICRDLQFSTMMEREGAIAEAHQQTFSWIFQENTPGNKAPWSSFTDWLRHGKGLYWIVGKAASGKSTLIKYIHESPTTTRLLREWAGGMPLATPRFYFWISGTAEQRSQTGLLRTLLFEILTQNKDLVPIVLPSRWAKRYSELAQPFEYFNVSRTPSDQWSTLELMEGFQALVKQESVPLKICLFIDGLDEYEGDYEKIAKLFREVITPNLKVCLSSRPLLPFHDAFQSFPCLELQNLTYDDIKKYVTTLFKDNAHFPRLEKREPVRALELMKSVVERAEGVFLWVKLVTRSLLDGLSNRDEISDLRQRLEALPKDLEELFKSMLDRIDPLYLERAAKIFLIIRASHRVADNARFPHKLAHLDTLSLSLAINSEHNQDCTDKPQAMSEEERREKRQIMKDQLKVWCAGLIEAVNTSPTHDSVQYLHRTVRDYLDQPDNLDMLVTRTAKNDFEPSTAMFRSITIQLQCINSFDSLEDGGLDRFSATALMYAHQADIDAKRANSELLNQFNRTMMGINGCDPNESFNGTSIFGFVVLGILVVIDRGGSQNKSEGQKRKLSMQLEIVELMLKHDANASILIDRYDGYNTARKLLVEVLFEFWPEKAREVDEMFQRHGGKLKPSKSWKLRLRK
ncbi:hypothetical protein AOQ84DRAFT_222678 [Glonium stellatum]|uniref:NACHT domain-containing protein n=1 Tax=Glonium stellatum TaxID=574774 RepID=A0A8E2F0C8_9PEZI|nr:hypothetical protein AOQ84DRAFT_222678 [Glonium stellatum]